MSDDYKVRIREETRYRGVFRKSTEVRTRIDVEGPDEKEARRLANQFQSQEDNKSISSY